MYILHGRGLKQQAPRRPLVDRIHLKYHRHPVHPKVEHVFPQLVRWLFWSNLRLQPANLRCLKCKQLINNL